MIQTIERPGTESRRGAKTAADLFNTEKCAGLQLFSRGGNSDSKRGVISSITYGGHHIASVNLAWAATLKMSRWTHLPMTKNITVDTSAGFNETNDGTLELREGEVDLTVFPKGYTGFKPGYVEGLPSTSERLLQSFPGLAFDRGKMLAVLLDMQLAGLATFLKGQSPGLSDIQVLLKQFRQEENRELFLRAYIAALTGCADIRTRVF